LAKYIFFYNFLDEDPALRHDEEKRIFQIQREAFHMVRPFCPKPWLEWEAGRFRNDSNRRLPGIFRTRGDREKIGQEERTPIFSRKRGSIFWMLPVCSSETPKSLLGECRRILAPEGKIAIGFVPRQSPWAKFCMEKAGRLKSSAPPPRFYSVGEMEQMMMKAGFSLQGIISTLFQRPGTVRTHEKPMKGYRSQAGILILLGECSAWAT
jgi:hypothetical protein